MSTLVKELEKINGHLKGKIKAQQAKAKSGAESEASKHAAKAVARELQQIQADLKQVVSRERQRHGRSVGI